MDVKSLKKKIAECGISIEELSAIADIDPSTYYRKINTNGENFTVAQAKKMAAALGMTKEEASRIFLA